MNATAPTVLESEVLEMLLAGDNPQLELLRNQLTKSVISSRKYTGTGFFATFHVPSDVDRLSKRERITIADISANVQGIKHGAGFALFVDEGVLNFLEGYTYDEVWPTKIENFKLTYLEENPRGSGRLHCSSVRDVEFGLRDLPAKV